ncbi:hypothetical protein DFQ30_002139 [Apophysomyces sp. BC1015]|nr:hypothetical protein DFQ30_002139 [Apophysomyces sp. BC1015]
MNMKRKKNTGPILFSERREITTMNILSSLNYIGGFLCTGAQEDPAEAKIKFTLSNRDHTSGLMTISSLKISLFLQTHGGIDCKCDESEGEFDFKTSEDPFRTYTMVLSDDLDHLKVDFMQNGVLKYRYLGSSVSGTKIDQLYGTSMVLEW